MDISKGRLYLSKGRWLFVGSEFSLGLCNGICWSLQDWAGSSKSLQRWSGLHVCWGSLFHPPEKEKNNGAWRELEKWVGPASKVSTLGPRGSRGPLGPKPMRLLGPAGLGARTGGWLQNPLSFQPRLLRAMEALAVSSWWGDIYQLIFYFWWQNCVGEGVWKAAGDVKRKDAPGGASGFGFEFC